MKYLANLSGLFSALVLLCGCGGGGKISSPPPGPPPNIAGNWQLTTTSTAGMSPLTIAGSINQSSNSLAGAVHADGSACFDQLITIGFTGTLTGSNILLTFASIGGQVMTFTGNVTDTAFTGAYTIKGGCADGDHGNVTGFKIPSITGQLNGTFTTSGAGSFDVTAQLTQGNARSEGSFGISGTFTFGSSCLRSGTITTGTFPSGSFIIGTSVTLEVETGNGTVVFHGTADPATGEISGDYMVSGGTCAQSGTALFAASPWDY
jgi:hypothetical protein